MQPPRRTFWSSLGRFSPTRGSLFKRFAKLPATTVPTEGDALQHTPLDNDALAESGDKFSGKTSKNFPATSIANSPYQQPAFATQFNSQLNNQLGLNRKLFFPTFDSPASIRFWLFFILFISFYGVGVQTDKFTSWQAVGLILADFLLVNTAIILSVVSVLHLSVRRYQDMTVGQVVRQVVLFTLVLTPFATLMAKMLEVFLFEISLEFYPLMGETIVNTLLACLVSGLLMYYFSMQYFKVATSQQHYAQQLTEQNAQLKARITPHFFFNMLNTVQFLVETDQHAASEVITQVSKLYRMSFSEPKEIALLDEIEICEQYLAIEKHRFGEKLQVNWQLPDEDLLYDMVITSLTLQMVLEKMIVVVVEMTTQIIQLDIKITWENNWVTIGVTANLPNISPASQDSATSLQYNIQKNLNFIAAQESLRRHFGANARIDYRLDNLPWQATTSNGDAMTRQTATSHEKMDFTNAIEHVTTWIVYPLADVG